MEKIMSLRMMNWMVNIPARHWTRNMSEVGYDLHMELVPYWQMLCSRVETPVLIEHMLEMSTPVFKQWSQWQMEIRTVLSLTTPEKHLHLFGHLKPILVLFPPPPRVASWARRWEVEATALTVLPMPPITWLATETRLSRLHTRRGLQRTDWSAAQARSRRSSRSAT
jgi:hypothetical protein